MIAKKTYSFVIFQGKSGRPVPFPSLSHFDPRMLYFPFFMGQTAMYVFLETAVKFFTFSQYDK